MIGDNQGDVDDLAADDVTLAASDDVVARIRAHTAGVRRVEIAPDEQIHVWTAAPESGDAVVDVRPVPGSTTATATDADDTVVTTALAPVFDGLDLTDGSATFFTNDKTYRSRGVDFGPRHRGGGGVPLWVWIAVMAGVVIVALVGIAVAIASTGPVL